MIKKRKENRILYVAKQISIVIFYIWIVMNVCTCSKSLMKFSHAWKAIQQKELTTVR